MFKRKTFSFLTAAVALAGFVGAANASVVFTSNFEGYSNTDDNTVATYTQFPPTPTGWVAASNGYNSSHAGLNLVGTNNVYSFRYTNSGLTTANGKIGNLTTGTTYTISFDVSLDSGNVSPYSVGLVTFASGAARNDMSGGIPTKTSAVLATVSGSYDTTNSVWKASSGGTVSGSTITFSYTADGTEVTLGQDVALRFAGATSSANIDNVSVDVTGSPVPEPASLALMGLGGLLLISRRRRTQVDG